LYSDLLMDLTGMEENGKEQLMLQYEESLMESMRR
jgi:hypothetical protein